jgi:hypothetical protein
MPEVIDLTGPEYNTESDSDDSQMSEDLLCLECAADIGLPIDEPDYFLNQQSWYPRFICDDWFEEDCTCAPCEYNRADGHHLDLMDWSAYFQEEPEEWQDTLQYIMEM